MEDVAEEQDEHEVHHQDAKAHRQAELFEHFVHVFAVAVFGVVDARRQVLHDGQGIHGVQYAADGIAVFEVGFDADAPFAVEAANGGAAACGVEGGDGVQRHAAVCRRHAQVF